METNTLLTAASRLLFYCLLAAGFWSCNIIAKPEPLSKYSGWVIVQKPHSHPLVNNYIRYSVEIQRNDTVKRVDTYEYYFNMYNLGDTIKACR